VWRSISEDSLPLYEDDRGSPEVGALERDLVRDKAEEEDSGRVLEEAIAARYWMTFFVFSVLPAPDSPLAHDQLKCMYGSTQPT
jgi:hypothetical protein